MDDPMVTGARLRLLVADASAEWRATVQQVVACDRPRSGVECVAEAESAQECQELAQSLQPDVVLIDAKLPGGGVMTIARLSSRHPRVQTILMADELDLDELFASLRAGGRGLILKRAPTDRLLATLHGVMAGELALPRRLMRAVVDEFTSHGGRRPAPLHLPAIQRLSQREQEAVGLLLAGLDTAEIAERMYVSPGSVRAYLSRALTKLRVADREALRALASSRGMPAGR